MVCNNCKGKREISRQVGEEDIGVVDENPTHSNICHYYHYHTNN